MTGAQVEPKQASTPDVATHGMVRPSSAPTPPIRELRELNRSRKTQVDARTPEIQALEKVLQDTGIKLSSSAQSRSAGSSPTSGTARSAEALTARLPSLQSKQQSAE
jgi:hypothetical protein